jgi:hypothetical protein
MSWPPDPTVVPILLAAGWVVRAQLLSREEGHEAITRAACEGLGLSEESQRSLIAGVRAPDISPAGFLASLLPFGQARHALRAWSGTSTQAAIRDIRAFLAATHERAMALPEGPRRWAAIGELLHCVQDSYSPAHADRVDGRIVRVKHWGPLDALRRADEHGFPSDGRDSAWRDGQLTEDAQAAASASRRYLGIALHAAPASIAEFLDEVLAFDSGA